MQQRLTLRAHDGLSTARTQALKTTTSRLAMPDGRSASACLANCL